MSVPRFLMAFFSPLDEDQRAACRYAPSAMATPLNRLPSATQHGSRSLRRSPPLPTLTLFALPAPPMDPQGPCAFDRNKRRHTAPAGPAAQAEDDGAATPMDVVLVPAPRTPDLDSESDRNKRQRTTAPIPAAQAEDDGAAAPMDVVAEGALDAMPNVSGGATVPNVHVSGSTVAEARPRAPAPLYAPA